jgi:hypothetical protein
MKNKGQIKSNNLSKYRDEIITFSGVSVKKKGKPKKNSKIDPLSKLSRKEKRKLERKLKHAKNLAFHKKIEMPKLENLIERKQKKKSSPIDDLKQNKEVNIKKDEKKILVEKEEIEKVF